MNHLRRVCLTATMSFVAFCSFSQLQEEAVIRRFYIDFSSKTKEFATEVYSNCDQYLNENNLEAWSEYLTRVQIIENVSGKEVEFPLLSDVFLKDKCNPYLSYDSADFVPAAFNPLKYQFNFEAQYDQTYKVDGTNFIVHISSR